MSDGRRMTTVWIVVKDDDKNVPLHFAPPCL